jgi:hypothetical protein
VTLQTSVMNLSLRSADVVYAHRKKQDAGDSGYSAGKS